MLTILDPSLPLELEAGGPSSDAVITALVVCAQQTREGNHILFADRDVYRRLSAFYDKIDQRSAAILNRAESRLPQLKQIRDFAERAIRIVVAEEAARVTNGKRMEIVLPVSAIEAKSSLLSPPLLMVENLNDGHCYMKIVKSVVKSGVIPELNWLTNVQLKCEMAPGGGNTLANLFSYHKNESCRIGGAVADSDCAYPGAAYGATASALEKASTSAPHSPLFEHYVLNVRTIENCIPRTELRSISEKLDPVQLSNFEKIEKIFSKSPHWKLVPIKSGIRCFDLGQASAESVFWTNLLGTRQCKKDEQCDKKRDCVHYIVPPLSDKVLANSVSQPELFKVTEQCMDGVIDTWRELIVIFYSIFCSNERVTVF